MLNYITKLLFTAFTYSYNLANAVSPKCLELTNFPWVKLYMFQNRFTVIAQISTFMCMSFAKVLLCWQPALFMKLNSRSTVNVATVFVIVVILADVLMRVDMHVIRQCKEELQIKVYETEFNRQLCMPEGYDNVSLTVCEVYDIAENVYPIGCKVCKPSVPMVSILILLVLLFETVKFSFGFVRNFKRFTKSFVKRKPKVNAKTNQQMNDQNKDNQKIVEEKEIPKSKIIIVKEYNPALVKKVEFINDSTTTPSTFSDILNDNDKLKKGRRIFDSLNIDTSSDNIFLENTSHITSLSLPNVYINITKGQKETTSDKVIDDTKENSR